MRQGKDEIFIIKSEGTDIGWMEEDSVSYGSPEEEEVIFPRGIL